MVDDKLYMFNPFTISDATEKQISDTYTNLQNSLLLEHNAPYDIAKDIEVYANLCFLCGEMIARITEQYDLIKVDKDITETQALYSYRDNWLKEKEEKCPAIAYFEAQAKQTVKSKYEELAHLGAKLTRFKRAYESLETKGNALKKKMDALKYEIGG